MGPKEGCTPAQWPGDGPALNSPTLASVSPPVPGSHLDIPNSPTALRVSWVSFPETLGHVLEQAWALLGPRPAGDMRPGYQAAFPLDADSGLGRRGSWRGGVKRPSRPWGMVPKPSSQSWACCPHNASAQTPEGKHRRGVPKVGVRVAKGSRRGSREYSHRLIPGRPRREPGAAHDGSKFSTPREASGDTPGLAGFPQNGSKTRPPRLASREDSIPHPRPHEAET